MQNFCPLCLKSGVKKKIKLLQINLQEAVLVCEEEKCTWPFGCEDFVFYPRVVGKIWSCYWDDHKLTAPRLKENITVTKLVPRTAPVTTIKNVSKEYNLSSDIDSDLSKDNNINSLNTMKTERLIDNLHTSTHTELNMISCNSQEQSIVKNNILDNKITNGPNKKNCNLQVLDKCTESMISKKKNMHLLNKHLEEEKDVCTHNSQNINNIRGVPKITSIEKTNIDIFNVIGEDQIFMQQDTEKDAVNTNKPTSEILSISDKLETLVQHENDQLNSDVAVTKSNVNVTTVEIDGLPPITLSYEIPAHTLTTPETVTSNLQQTHYKRNIIGGTVSNNTKSKTLESKNTSVRRNVTSGKQYEKFSFSAIKKKIEPHNIIDTNSNSIKCQSIKSKLKMQQTENDSKNNTKKENFKDNSYNNRIVVNCNNDYKQTTSITHATTNCTSNQIVDSETINDLSGQENELLDTSTVNTSVNIDTVLEDLLTSDYIPEDINDEWIHSLLS